MMPEKILTAAQVAELFQVDRETVYKLAQRGCLPGFKVGSQWRFAEATIREWYTSRTTGLSPAESPVKSLEQQECQEVKPCPAGRLADVALAT